MITFKRLSQNEKIFSRMTGLSTNDFQALINLIKEDWEILEAKKKKSGRAQKIKTLEDKVVCLLIYYRSYVNTIFMGMLFDISDSNIVRLFQKLEPIIARKMNLKKIIKKELESDELLGLIVDATELKINRPKNNKAKKDFYSGKKKAHTAKIEIIRDKKTGKILSISKIYCGKTHDFLIRKLESKRGNQIPDRYNVSVCADLGYQGLQKEFKETKIFLPKKRSKNHPLSKEEKVENTQKAKERIKVEHSIGQMKKFKIIGEKYRKQTKKLHIKTIIIAGLVNLANGFIG